MTYKLNGYFRDGQTASVYAYDSKGHRVFIFKGYFNWKKNQITLYPFTKLAPTSDRIEKTVIPIGSLGREGRPT